MDDYNDAEQLAGVGGSALRGAGKIANAATRRLREKAIKKAKKESAAAIRKVAHLVKMVIAGLISILGPIGIIVLSFVVIIFMAFGATAGSSSSAGGTGMVGGSQQFTPRLTAPSTSSRYYYSTDNPFYPAYGMPNCTAYAFGRIYELNGSRPNLCTGNAEMWYDYNKSHNYYPYGSTPKLGAVAVWVHPGGGHVAVVEKIENNTVTYSNSAYNGTNFYLSNAPLSDPGNVGATDWTLQGYIYAYTPPISNTSSGIVNNLSAPQFERQFATFFEVKGFNKAMICGMLGNIFRETSYLPSNYFAGYVPDAFGAVGNSGGICMWYGDNCTRFKRDCPNWGVDVTAQFEYLYQTLIKDGQGSYNDKYYYWCTGCLSRMQAVPNTKDGARQAARIFHDYYERSATGSADRMEFAATTWDNLS